MCDAGGFVKLNRSILDWEWYSSPVDRSLFIHCILKANWKPGRWQGIEVGRGQFATSRSRLAEETGHSVRSIRTALSHLASTGELIVETDRKFTKITVVNYDKYQCNDDIVQIGVHEKYNEVQKNRKKSTSDRPSANAVFPTVSEDCVSEIDQQPTNDRPATDQQPTTIEEGKKGRRKEGKKEELLPGVEQYLLISPPQPPLNWQQEVRDTVRDVVGEMSLSSGDRERIGKALGDYAEMRKSNGNVLTKPAVHGIIQDLIRLAPSRDSPLDVGKAVKILEQSTKNCWKGLYELRDGNGTQRKRGSAYIDAIQNRMDVVKEWAERNLGDDEGDFFGNNGGAQSGIP